MKKIVFIPMILAFVMTAGNTLAQGFGVKGSFNMFNMTIKNSDGDKVETGMVPEFNVGLFAEFHVADEFFICPELFFATKGAKLNDALVKTTYNLSYLELPVLFCYKGVLSDNRVLLGFGPYLALGVGGMYKQGSNEYDIKFKNDISTTSSGVAYFKPLDIGAMLEAGYELSGGFSVALNTSMGLTNIYPKINGEKTGMKFTNVGFGMTVGYRFAKK